MSVSNNKVGVHILFPSELRDAAKLVNSNGGDWGYVTIPIQINDKNLQKWQGFMDSAKENHIIPIVRLATEGNYFEKSAWTQPAENDVLDFANFLNSLNWPVKNRYVVIFNEPNRGDEWEGSSDPAGYARILNYSAKILKSLNQDFFVISAGLDNGASNEYAFLQGMENAEPGIFDQIDGFGSHSYPNPGFSQPPTYYSSRNINSFSYELDFVRQFTSKNLPVFITETGWSQAAVSDLTIASYYRQAFSSVWSNPNIVAVTPFILNAGAGPFVQFSLLDKNGEPNAQYLAIQNLPKIKGSPVLNEEKNLEVNEKKEIFSFKNFVTYNIKNLVSFKESDNLKNLFKWLLGI